MKKIVVVAINTFAIQLEHLLGLVTMYSTHGHFATRFLDSSVGSVRACMHLNRKIPGLNFAWYTLIFIQFKQSTKLEMF